LKGVKTIRRKLSFIIKRLEKDRDDLRNLQYEIETLLEDKDEDIQDLERILDSLSRYV
jgi:hypothetical protein